MPETTPLHQCHIDAGATMMDFGGWDMPLHYGSQRDEHNAVRADAGMFDVSHMCVTDLSGARTREFLRYLLANDVARLRDHGRALYTCMLNESGGVLDDLIVYRMGEDDYRIVSNAATREKDLAWISSRAEAFSVVLNVRAELAMIAVQGPRARERAAPVLLGDEAAREAALSLRPFHAAHFADGLFIAHTGYTGEAGWEIILPAAQAAGAWQALAAAGIVPCGLGARDTLRLEAGMCLYGADMTEATSPLESALGWTVAMSPPERDFIGRGALQKQLDEGVAHKLVGLVLEARGVLRAHQVVQTGAGEGEVTSGTFSPTIGKSIALARVPADCGLEVEVEIRGRRLAARVVKPPFVRHGEILVEAI